MKVSIVFPSPLSGTSTDVSRFAGQYEHVFETTTAGITIQAPQVMYDKTIEFKFAGRNMFWACLKLILAPAVR